MNYVFWIDDPLLLNPLKDTSLALMKEVSFRGDKVYALIPKGLSVLDGVVRFRVQPVNVTDEWAVEVDSREVCFTDEDVDFFVIRKDPPFDEDYLCQTWLLDLLEKKVCVTNNPSGLRSVNEKIWVNQFKDLTPKTLITSSLEDYMSFLAEHKFVVLKPYNGFGGQGVTFIHHEDKNAKVLFEYSSYQGERLVVVQKFLKKAPEGDKRVLLLNGEILQSVLRKNEQGDYRHNFMAGGSAFACDVTAKEKDAIDQLRPFLKSQGLHFVGLDFIGEYLIEVNVTSPTCLREMNLLYDTKLEVNVVDFFESLKKMN
ncbi:hypothetical protein AB834_04645 [PVC group bacterium (ex Bugula neritina AB1)]|nr:hypothetical protein AB834_04645 [PVC group bacterium (ex Bugula neritina AB1)]